MPLSFRIFSRRGLVVVRYEGEARIDDTMRAFAEYASHTDFAPGQKQLIDLTQITSYEKDYARVMQMQAIKADSLTGKGEQALMVYLAPTPAAQELSGLIVKSWEDVDSVVPMIQHSEAQALAILGQPETTLEALYAAEDRDALQ